MHIDDLQRAIEQRLNQARDEANKLEAALDALRSARTQTRADPPAATKRQKARTPRHPRQPTQQTREAVREALAMGDTMTAGELGEATGRKHDTISTPPSNLAKAGAVTKAERGYRLPQDPTNSVTNPVMVVASELAGDGGSAERTSPIATLRSELDAGLRTRV